MPLLTELVSGKDGLCYKHGAPNGAVHPRPTPHSTENSEEARKGSLKRTDHFPDLAKEHNVGVMFVLFDGVGDPFPKPDEEGRQSPRARRR
jgi:hypothetical protein